MEEIYPPPSSPKSCTNELTRTSSCASSVTASNSIDTLLPSGNATTDKNTGWTNEKHDTFLDCLEASFVTQLHRSMVLRARCVEVNKSCRNISEGLYEHVNKAAEQFPVLHDGCWKKIDTVKEPPVLYTEADSHDCLKDLRSDEHHNILDIQLCCKPCPKEKRPRDKRSSSCGHETRSHLILSKPVECWKTVSRLTEGSGQNFVEDNSSCKRMKMASVNASEQEQIVPTRNSGSSGVAMFKRNDQVNLESSSKN